MALDAEVVNDLRNIATEVQSVGSASDDAQNRVRRMGQELDSSMRRSRDGAQRSSRAWRDKRQALEQATRAQQQNTVAQRAGRAAMGQVNSAAGALTGSLRMLQPALMVPAAVMASWQALQRNIQETQRTITSTVTSAQDVATGGGFAAQGGRLQEMAMTIASTGAFDADMLLRGAGAFKGTAKDADFNTTVQMMQQMQRLGAAGFADPTSLARQAGSLVQGGMDVRTATNLSAFLATEGGEDAPMMLRSLRAGISRFGADAAPTLIQHLLAADDARSVQRVGSMISQADPDEGIFALDFALRKEETPRAAERRRSLRPRIDAAGENFVADLVRDVSINNPILMMENEARREENLTRQMQMERNLPAAQRRRLLDARMRQAQQNGGVSGAAANIIGGIMDMPIIGAASQMTAEAADRAGIGAGSEVVFSAEREVLSRIADAAEQTARKAGRGEGL